MAERNGERERDTSRAGAEELWSPKRLAEHLGIPVKTLYMWRYRGQGPPSMRIGRYLRFRASEVEKWLAARDQTCRPPVQR